MKNLQTHLKSIIRSWREAAKYARVSGSELINEINKNEFLPSGVTNRHDYFQGMSDAFTQAANQVESLLIDPSSEDEQDH